MCININKISKSFGDKNILSEFSTFLPTDKTICFFGNSGSGKTTLLNIIGGVISKDSGEIYGMENKKVAMVFQEDRLLKWLCIYDNVSMVNKNGNAEEILKKLNLYDYKDSSTEELSGGMLRKVAISRALNYDFDILLLDEPFKGLDNKSKKEVFKVIKEYTKNKMVILVTHNIDDAIIFSDIIYVMEGFPLKIKNMLEIKTPFDIKINDNKDIAKYREKLENLLNN